MRRVKPEFMAYCRVSPLLGRLAGATITIQPSHIGEHTENHLVQMGIWRDVSRFVGLHLGFYLNHRSRPQYHAGVLKYEGECIGGYLVLRDIQ